MYLAGNNLKGLGIENELVAIDGDVVGRWDLSASVDAEKSAEDRENESGLQRET
jgi:hypothetical protein